MNALRAMTGDAVFAAFRDTWIEYDRKNLSMAFERGENLFAVMTGVRPVRYDANGAALSEIERMSHYAESSPEFARAYPAAAANPAHAPGFSRLGFGVSGPHASLTLPARQTERLIREALELGVSLFDTGPAYGGGEAEKRLDRALKGRRERAFVATKAGIGTDRQRDFSPGAIEMSLKASLGRLGMGHVDLLLLHGPAPHELTDRLFDRLDAFRTRGLFRSLGVCGRGAELDAALDSGRIDALMAPVHAGLDDTALARLDRARADGLAVIGIETMAGARRPTGLPFSPGEAWYALRRMKRALTGTTPPAPAEAQSPAEALKWALARPACDAVVCLTTKPANLQANAAAADLEAKRRAS